MAVCTNTAAGAVLAVRVIPRAKKAAVDGVRDGALLVRLSAPPVEGAANDALMAFLSDLLKIPRRSLRLVSGERSRQKRVLVSGTSAEDVAARLKI